MDIRITSIPGDQLQICRDNSIWGSNNSGLAKWKKGDVLVFCVNKEIAAVAEISGLYDVSDVQLWDNGLYPWRIPLRFTHCFEQKNRIPISGEIRESFIRVYGKNYGYVFLNKLILKHDVDNLLLAKIGEKPNNI